MQENPHSRTFVVYLNVVSDNLDQNIAQKLNRNYFFSLHSIRVNTVHGCWECMASTIEILAWWKILWFSHTYVCTHIP